MTFPRPKNPILAFLFHPALAAGIVVPYAYYFFLSRFFGASPAETRAVESHIGSDLAFYCWILLLASTILFADVFAFLATLGGPNIARANMDDVRSLSRKLNRTFIKGWLFGLSVYSVCAAGAWYAFIRAIPGAGKKGGASALAHTLEKHGAIVIIAYAVVAIVLLFILPKRLSNLIVEKGWSKGLYRVATGFALAAVFLLGLSIARGQPLLFRKNF